MSESNEPEKKKRRGRPRGSKNKPKVNARVAPPRCVQCQSTEISIVKRLGEMQWEGKAPDGLPCTHVVRRSVSCNQCKQAFIQTTYENRAG